MSRAYHARMATRFRTSRDTAKTPASPEALFRELRPTDRAIRDLLSRQADVLRDYHELDPSLADVALELPTGAGKTLVGLLLADFRRRAKGERAAYLCPTIQLARQVARKGAGYGLPYVLTGPQRDYSPLGWNKYVRGQAVAVTTYSALFNTNPRIDNGETLILDDAHAGEGYVSSLWSLSVQRERDSLYAPLLSALKGGLSRGFAGRLDDSGTATTFEAAEVELVAPNVVFEQADLLREAIAAHTTSTDDPNHWTARMLGGQIEHCLAYVSWREILIRPLIPPTAHHRAFADANQRIYMSATLGAGGELERAFGVTKIRRLAVPASADKQGLGRRFFMFPASSRNRDAANDFVREAIAEVGRAVVITPSNREREQFEQRCLPDDVETIAATDVEEGFDDFVDEERAALMLLANRYDGLDLPDDACRLVVLSGLPAYTHLQERFLLDRLLAGRVTAERVRTRITQGAGRCTRNAKDYAAVIVHGDRLAEFCSRDEEVAAMLPELSEIEFGLKNSESGDDLMELLRLFLAQDEAWAEGDDDIRADTDERERVLPPGVEELQRAVEFEVKAWRSIWRGDVAKALKLAQASADALDEEEELRGYRALWIYLAACWAGELASEGDDEAATLAASLRADAETAARILRGIRASAAAPSAPSAVSSTPAPHAPPRRCADIRCAAPSLSPRCERLTVSSPTIRRRRSSSGSRRSASCSDSSPCVALTSPRPTARGVTATRSGSSSRPRPKRSR